MAQRGSENAGASRRHNVFSGELARRYQETMDALLGSATHIGEPATDGRPVVVNHYRRDPESGFPIGYWTGDYDKIQWYGGGKRTDNPDELTKAEILARLKTLQIQGACGSMGTTFNVYHPQTGALLKVHASSSQDQAHDPLVYHADIIHPDMYGPVGTDLHFCEEDGTLEFTRPDERTALDPESALALLAQGLPPEATT
jgi:hypothetical protein